MSYYSKIEWTDTTWNPIRGCSRVSEGCRHCYAEDLAVRFSSVGQPFHGFASRWRETLTDRIVPGTNEAERKVVKDPHWTGYVQLVEDKLLEPLSWREPRRVFVNSMSDLFHENLSDEAIDRVFAVMALCCRHTFQVLTKRPERMLRYLRAEDRSSLIEEHLWQMHTDYTTNAMPIGPLKNVWLGVSCENQATADERIPLLLQTPAAVRFVSAEPLLGPIDISEWVWGRETTCSDCPMDVDCECGFRPRATFRDEPQLHWLIAGAESGRNARNAEDDWFRSLRDQCVDASVAFFLKQKAVKGKKISLPELDGKQWAQFPQIEALA